MNKEYRFGRKQSEITQLNNQMESKINDITLQPKLFWSNLALKIINKLIYFILGIVKNFLGENNDKIKHNFRNSSNIS